MPHNAKQRTAVHKFQAKTSTNLGINFIDMFWATFLYGIGYVCFAVYGFTLDPRKKFYNKLLQKKTYLIHLLINIVISGIGYYRCKNVDPKEAFIFAPMIFLMLLHPVNLIVKLATNRNVLITSRWDKKLPGYKWYLDSLAGFILVAIPSIASGLIMNKFRFGHFFVN